MNPNTIVGDLLHHKGRLIDVRIRADGTVEQQTVQFDGYTSWLASLAALQVQATENADGSLTLTSLDAAAFKHDWWGVTTNLLEGGTQNRVMLDLKQGGTLNNTLPAPVIYPVTLSTAPYSYSYSELGVMDEFGMVPLGDQVVVELAQRVLAVNYPDWDRPAFPKHRMTVTEILTLDLFGSGTFPGQDTEYGTFEDRELVLTPFGLVLKCNMVVPLIAPLLSGSLDFGHYPTGGSWWSDGGWGLEPNPTLQLNTVDDEHPAAASWIYPIAIRFSGYGWPTEGAPGFLSPRKPRVLAEPARGTASLYIEGQGKTDEASPDHHPNIQKDPIYADGQDYDITSLSGDQMKQETTQVAILTPLPNPVLPADEQGGIQREQPFEFPIWPNPDGAADFLEKRDSYATDRAWLLNGGKSNKLVRVHGLREFYNAMATAVNGVKKGRAYDFFQHYPAVRPNSLGPFGDQTDPGNPFRSIRPRNHFATVTEGDALWTWATANNVPIKGVADLPQSLRDLEAVQQVTRTITHQVERKSTITEVVLVREGEPEVPSYYRYTTHTQISLGSFVDRVTSRSGSLYDALLAAALTFSQDYRWIALEDIRAAAERLGFPFVFERVVLPLALKAFSIGPAQELFRSGSTWESDEEFIEYYGVGPYHPVGKVLSNPFTAEIAYESRVPTFVEAITDAEADWIRDDYTGLPLYLLNRAAGDVLTTWMGIFGGGRVIYRLEADARLRRNLPELNANALSQRLGWLDSAQQRVGYPASSVLVQSLVSTGLTPESVLVLINSDYFEHDGSTFSETSYAAAAARLQHGNQVLPVKTRACELGSQAVPIVPNADTFMAADPEGLAQRVILYRDWPLKW